MFGELVCVGKTQISVPPVTAFGPEKHRKREVGRQDWWGGGGRAKRRQMRGKRGLV